MKQSEGNFRKQLVISILLFVFALILIYVSVFAWLAIIGIPIGVLLISFSIWYFAMWFYKKQIPFKEAVFLFLLPFLPIIRFILVIGNKIFEGLLGFQPSTPPNAVPYWTIILSFIYTIILPAILWIFGILIIFYFFKRQKLS